MSRDNKRIATLWDNKNSDEHDDHEHPHRDHGQAFYAGGSEHSGQQILGPSNDGSGSDRLVENLFQHASHSAALLHDQSNSSTDPSNANSVPLRFWRNGFTIGEEGELREYDTPDNRRFIESLKRGETPAELASRVRGGMIDVKLEKRLQEDYKPQRKVQAFAGEGHRLGAPTPETVDGQESSTPTGAMESTNTSSLVVDESQPVTNIQVRLADNTRVVIRTNHTTRVADLVSHIRSIRPQYSSVNFVLATTFPAKELTNLEQTISEAKLANASVLQKIKY